MIKLTRALLIFLVTTGLLWSGYGFATPTLPTSQRLQAATTTAQSISNPCLSIRPFYWEIGDKASKLAAGSVDREANALSYKADTPLAIASASKWLYAAYVAQRQKGRLSASDIQFLTLRSGYSHFLACRPRKTVDNCLNLLGNGRYSAQYAGQFAYGGGHMQKHASLMGLGDLDNEGLADAVRSQIGTDIHLYYNRPQPAGGAVSSAADYAVFLRKMMNGQLQIAHLLGRHTVCTNPNTCPAGEAMNTPIPQSESWHYSIGHWVEDDPVVGDGSLSSPGALGFYPWIDASRNTYGIVSRQAANGALPSVQCGRLIRKAWNTGIAQ
jgi:hypothetical protein